MTEQHVELVSDDAESRTMSRVLVPALRHDVVPARRRHHTRFTRKLTRRRYAVVTTVFIARQHAMHAERDSVLPILSVRLSVHCWYCV